MVTDETRRMCAMQGHVNGGTKYETEFVEVSGETRPLSSLPPATRTKAYFRCLCGHVSKRVDVDPGALVWS